MAHSFLVDVTLASLLLLCLTQLGSADNRKPIASECPKGQVGHDTTNIPHETDCAKYYACADGKKYPQECPPMDNEGNKLHFNPELQTCDWPWNVTCQSTKIIAMIEPIAMAISKNCPKYDKPGQVVHLAHESDCTKFYKCNHGVKVEMDCPFVEEAGYRLHFNEAQQYCDWPENAKCESFYPSPSSPTDNGCKGDCPVGGSSCYSRDRVITMPHMDCGKYCVCRSNEILIRKCPGRLQYSAIKGTCVYLWDSECVSPNSPQTTWKPATSPQTTWKPATSPQTTWKPATSPQTSWKPKTSPQTTWKPATSPQATWKPTTSPRTTWKPTTSPRTTRKPPTSPQTTRTPSSRPQTTWKLPNHLQTTRTPPTSPQTTQTPPTRPRTTQTTPTRPQTTQTPLTRPPTTGTPPTRPQTTRTPPTSPPTTRTPPTSPLTTRTPPTSLPSNPADPSTKGCLTKCPQTDPEFAIHMAHENCAKFCECGNGVAYVMDCPPGLYWSRSTESCDHRRGGQCRYGIYQPDS